MVWVITQYAWDQRVRTRLFDATWLVVGTSSWHSFIYATGRVFYIEGVEEQWDRYSFDVDVIIWL